FEEGLKLLSRRGDRWAETVNLLVEIVDKKETMELVTKLVEALEDSDTWDIATRVLAGIGDMVGPKLSGLLASENELPRRGAVKILGKIRAIQYVNDLASLAGDHSWRVRREAVEALIMLKEHKHLAAYAADPQPSVLRSVFRGRLLLEDSPIEIIRGVIKKGNPIHQEQMAWATHDLFSALLKRLTEADICELMKELLEHENNDVKLLSYLMA
ncbi:MAG: HEAT repeat domain-containing protein, partial [Desulfobacteraceae bacterium]